MEKMTLLLLHGWGLSKGRFEETANALKRHGFEVYALDFPGFGREKAPDTGWYLEDYAKYLHTFIADHHIKNPVFIGHSFGGRVSLKYNQMYPKSVRALILSGTPGFTPINRNKLTFFILLTKLGNAFFSVPPFFIIKDRIRRLYYYLVGAREFYRAEGSMRQTFKNIVQEELVVPMQTVRIPCLLVWGENDQIVPVAIAKRMQEMIQGSTLIILPNVDHGVSFRAPEQFVQAVLPFLKHL